MRPKISFREAAERTGLSYREVKGRVTTNAWPFKAATKDTGGIQKWMIDAYLNTVKINHQPANPVTSRNDSGPSVCRTQRAVFCDRLNPPLADYRHAGMENEEHEAQRRRK
jgi:hypothetical protein